MVLAPVTIALALAAFPSHLVAQRAAALSKPSPPGRGQGEGPLASRPFLISPGTAKIYESSSVSLDSQHGEGPSPSRSFLISPITSNTHESSSVSLDSQHGEGPNHPSRPFFSSPVAASVVENISLSLGRGQGEGSNLSSPFLSSPEPEQAPDPRTFRFAGQTVHLHFPPPTDSQRPSPEIAGWGGWAGIAGPSPVFDTPFRAPGAWKTVDSNYPQPVSDSGTVRWRTKIVILANLDTLDIAPDGTLHARRNDIVGSNFLEVLDAIPQLVATVSVLSKGRVLIDPDVLIDPEAARDDASDTSPAFGPEYLRAYLESRVNGGSYEADDKIYRGPYHSILFITPAAQSTPTLLDPQVRTFPTPFSIDGMPAASVPYYAVGGASMPGSLAVAMVDAWTALASQRFEAAALPPISGTLDRGDWAQIANLTEPPTQTSFAAPYAAGTGPFPIAVSNGFHEITLPEDTFQGAYKTANVGLEIRKDPEKGDVLTETEARTSRFGGFCLPHGSSPIVIDKTPSLTIAMRTVSPEPISLRVSDSSGKTFWYSFGRNPVIHGAKLPECTSLPFSPDGSWHDVTVNLKESGLTTISQMEIGASPAAAVGPVPGSSIMVQFASFRLGSDTPTPDLDLANAPPTDPEPRIARAVLLAKKGAASPELISLLKDADDEVVLNAAAAYGQIVDPMAETTLADLAFSPSPRVSEMALKALAHQHTPTADAAVDRSLRSGLEYAREVAGFLVGERADPSTAVALVVLLAGQAWHTRLEGVEALSKVPGRQAAMMRLAFLQQDDPLIRLAVVKNADPKADEDMRKLLWLAVNDPSDMVRAWSDTRLMQSPDPKFRAEGEKGVRDDSWWVRLQILAYLKFHPDEVHRPTIHLAMTDRLAVIRAAAIEALNELETVGVEEIAPLQTDKDPAVIHALQDLIKRHKLAGTASILITRS